MQFLRDALTFLLLNVDEPFGQIHRTLFQHPALSDICCHAY